VRLLLSILKNENMSNIKTYFHITKSNQYEMVTNKFITYTPIVSSSTSWQIFKFQKDIPLNKNKTQCAATAKYFEK